MELNGLSAKIAEYIARRAEARLDKFDKAAAKQRQTVLDAAAMTALGAAQAAERSELSGRYEPVNWLADAAMRAKQIQMVTHALKFTHTDAKGSSFYAPEGLLQAEEMSSGELLSTASLANPAIDTVGNAAALDVAALLQLQYEGKTLIRYIKQGDSSPLQPFAQDENQLTEWIEAFKQVLIGNELSSHKLAKQLYFPLANGQYHLLAPIYSSSLAYALYGRIASSRYPDKIKIIRKAKKDGKYHSVDYLLPVPGIQPNFSLTVT